tara:strand:- start:95 stop:2149 length:2055 start_codon:yes stop_codon:yes gene_type:complete
MINSRINYRNEIDGLRSLSVIFVILYHLYPDIFNGGFLGVDIFFVISGYVITQSLYNSNSQNFFEFIKNFYTRRILRIYPLLIVVSLSTLVITLIFFSYTDFNFLFYSFVTSIIGLSNLYYIKTGKDYFLDEIDNPFLHTWSLGVEEQFYLLYPILLFILLKNFSSSNIKLFITFILLIILSKFLSIIISDNQILTFYFPFARFWELLIGCLLFFIFKDYKSRISSFKYQNFLIFISLLIVSSLLFFAKQVNLAFVMILTIFSSSSLILLSSASFINKILNNFYMVYIGKISFGLYLWHYPILYFVKGRIENHILLSIFVIIISFIISIFTYEYFENPIRYNKKLKLKLRKALSYSYILVVFFVLFIFSYPFSKIYLLKVEKSIRLLAENISLNHYQKSKKTNSHYSAYNFLGRPAKLCQQSDKKMSYFETNCFKVNKSKKNETLFFLVGDSIATSFLPMFDKLSNEGDVYLSSMSGAFYLPKLSYSETDIFPKNYIDTQNHIKNNLENFYKISKNYKNNFFIIANMYRYYIHQTNIFDNEKKIKIQKKNYHLQIENNLDELISKIPKNSKIIIIPQTLVLNQTREECFRNRKRYKNNCDINDKEYHLNYSKNLFQSLKNLKSKHSNLFVYDIIDIICPNSKCNYFRKNLDSYYFDKGHITVETSLYLSSHFNNFLENKVLNKR